MNRPKNFEAVLEKMQIKEPTSTFYGEWYSQCDVFQKDIDIHLNKKCNLHCPYCSSRPYEHITEDISDETVQRIHEKLQKMPVKPNICLLGGEPMLHKKFCDIVDLLRPDAVLFDILTNGTVPIKKVQDVNYILSMHEGLTPVQKANFIKNCLLLKAHGASLVIALTEQRQFREFEKLGLQDYVRQLHIDRKSAQRFARNVHNEYYYLNGHKIKSDDVLRFRMHRFKEWKCQLRDIVILNDGSGYCACRNEYYDVLDTDFSEPRVITCPLEFCNNECHFDNLKAK